MNPIRWIWLRARALFGRRALERDMKHEVNEHLARATERMIARGMTPFDARNAALREFGNVAMIEEDARDARGTRLVESVVADIRFALRYFGRKPLTTATIVIVLALGIGVHTALFTILQAFTVRAALGVPKDASHVRIWGLHQDSKGARRELRDLSYAELTALARKATFSEVAGWTHDEVIIDRQDGGGARGLAAEFVTPNYWKVLGVAIQAGPGYATQDPLVEDLAAVISSRMSADLFASPAEAVGSRILVNDVPIRIVGVAPPRFEGAIPDNGRPQLWLPLSARAQVARTTARWLNEDRLSVFARLAPSVTAAQATVVARDVAARVLSDSAARAGVQRSAEVVSLRARPPITSLAEDIIGFVALGVVALLILLVACTNVSSLLVAAAVGRRHEIAVRLSLGASRMRILRQLLTETALLAIGGGTAGLLLCWWVTTYVAKLTNVDIVPDAWTVAFTMAFALGTGLLFGLSPALHATRAGVATALRDSGTGVSARSKLQRTFVVAQIVFSQPLLVLLAVVLATIFNSKERIPARVADRVISAHFRPLYQAGAPGQREEAVEALARLVATQPGVERVVPEPAAFEIRDIVLPSANRDSALDRTSTSRIHLMGAPPGYFALLDIALTLGRDVSLEDTAAREMPIVLGSGFSRTLWGGENPVGKRLQLVDSRTRAPDSTVMVVVGVIDAPYLTAGGAGEKVFTARGKQWRHDALMIGTSGPAQPHVPRLRQFVHDQVPGLPVTSFETFADIARRDQREGLYVTSAAVAAGAVALLLASIGLFAVVALAVGQRRREIGIRIALGAEPLRVAGMFFVSGLGMSVAGLLIGLPISVVSLQVMMSQGIILAPPFNVPVMGLGIALVVLSVAGAATWFPARKAATVDPSLALRAE